MPRYVSFVVENDIYMADHVQAPRFVSMTVESRAGVVVAKPTFQDNGVSQAASQAIEPTALNEPSSSFVPPNSANEAACCAMM